MSIAEFTTRVTEFIEIHRNFIYPFIFFIAFCESLAFVSLLVPATIILASLSIFLGDSDIPFILVWLSAASGAFIGDWVSYEMGFRFKDTIPHLWPFNKNPALLEKGQLFFQKWGGWSVFIGRFFGPIRAVIALSAGIYCMDKRLFFIANFCSAIIWGFGILAPGALGIPSLFAFFH